MFDDLFMTRGVGQRGRASWCGWMVAVLLWLLTGGAMTAAPMRDDMVAEPVRDDMAAAPVRDDMERLTDLPQDSLRWGSVHRQDTLTEVVVTSRGNGRRVIDQQIGVEKVDVATMSRLPAMFGERDIIKSLQLLPGVKQEGDGLGGYQVRGGTSAQNHILLDGASVYNIGHLMGLFSSFNDDAMGNVELFKGLMAARYSGGSSSLLNIVTRSGAVDDHHLTTSVGLLSAKAEADGPLGSGGSSYLVAGRVSYLDFFIKGTPKYSKNTLRFYDANARLNFRLGDADQLSLALFHSSDRIDVEKMLATQWTNTSGSLSWLYTRGSHSYALTQLVGSNYTSKQGMEMYSFSVNMKGYDRQVTLRHQQTWEPMAAHALNAGAETTLMGLQSAEWRIQATHEREKRDIWVAALWLQDDMSLWQRRLQLSAGLRCEWISPLGGKPYYELDDQGRIVDTFHPRRWSLVKTYACLQPRLSLTWRLTSQVSVKAGYSRLVQSVQPVRNSSMTLPLDRLAFTSNNVKPQVADQVAAGLTVATADGGWDWTADGYWKRLKNVYDFREGKVFTSDIEIERLITGGRGRAYGMELAMHRNKGALTGWVAYTLSWVQNQIDGIMGGRWYTAPNDRRHDLTLVMMAELGKGWTLASTWRYTTGQAMTAPTGKYELNGETHYYFGPRNESRAPAYHRLDLSAAYSTRKGKATRTWTFGLFNAYNRYNPFFVSFKEQGGTDVRSSDTKAVVTSIFGIVPTVSFTYEY